MGATLVLDFDRHSVASGGRFLVGFDGVPEPLQFKRAPRGLLAQVGSQWVDVADDDLCNLDVIGLVLTVCERASTNQVDVIQLHQQLGNSENPHVSI